MIQESTSPVVATWPTVPCESSDHGSRISVAAGVISFFRALHPDYASGSIQMELPTLCADPPKKDYQSLLQGAELAIRMTCAYVGLPATVVACIGGAANFSAVARWFGSSLAALVADNVVNRDDENPSQTRKKQRHKTCQQSARLPQTAVGLGAASCLGVVGAVPTAGHKPWIVVNDSSVLDKIGRDPAYPLDGRYRQLADIEAGNLSGPIGNTSHPFAGEYDGRCQSIDKLRHCFVQRLDGNGRIDNVRFTRADIASREKAGVVACELTGRATLANIVVEHSTVGTDGTSAPAGIGAGAAYGHSLIDGFRTFNCTTKTIGRYSDAGAVAGVVSGVINNTRLDNARVETFHDDSHAGGGAGELYGTIDNTVMIDGKVVTHGSNAHAGGAAGRASRGIIENTVLTSTDLITENHYSHAAGGAGEVGLATRVVNTLLVNCNLRTDGAVAYAAGGGGKVFGRIINTTMVYGRIETSTYGGQAAVGAGHLLPGGRVYNTTGRQVVIRTGAVHAAGAVGAAWATGVVEGVVCFKSDIMTSSMDADAGFGVGWLDGRVSDVAANGCHVTTFRDQSDAGFGAGAMSSKGYFRNLTVINSTAHALDSRAREAVNGGDYFFACNSSVGEYESPPCCNKHTHKLCVPVPQDVCRLADPRVLTKDCRPVAPPYFAAEKGNRSVCPPPRTAPSSTSTDSASYTLTTPTLPSIEANVTTTIHMTNSTMPMPVNSPVPLILTAPVAAGMSTGALAGGIVAGVVALGLVGAAGFVLYRRYHQQSLRAEGAYRFTDLDDF